MINQDSILIKHDFDAGESKLMRTHGMTQKANMRMLKLIAMLKHKTGGANFLETSPSDSQAELVGQMNST